MDKGLLCLRHLTSSYKEYNQEFKTSKRKSLQSIPVHRPHQNKDVRSNIKQETAGTPQQIKCSKEGEKIVKDDLAHAIKSPDGKRGTDKGKHRG